MLLFHYELLLFEIQLCVCVLPCHCAFVYQCILQVFLGREIKQEEHAVANCASEWSRKRKKISVVNTFGLTTQHYNDKLCLLNHIFYCMLLLILKSAWAEQNCKLCLDFGLWAVLPSSLSMVSSQTLSLLIAGFLIFGINCLCFSCWQSRFSWTSSRQQNVDKACTFFQENWNFVSSCVIRQRLTESCLFVFVHMIQPCT